MTIEPLQHTVTTKQSISSSCCYTYHRRRIDCWTCRSSFRFVRPPPAFSNRITIPEIWFTSKDRLNKDQNVVFLLIPSPLLSNDDNVALCAVLSLSLNKGKKEPMMMMNHTTVRYGSWRETFALRYDVGVCRFCIRRMHFIMFPILVTQSHNIFMISFVVASRFARPTNKREVWNMAPPSGDGCELKRTYELQNLIPLLWAQQMTVDDRRSRFPPPCASHWFFARETRNSKRCNKKSKQHQRDRKISKTSLSPKLFQFLPK